MSDTEFKYFLELLMCADPWPVSDNSGNSVTDNEATLKKWADEEAQRHGYPDWITAYWAF